jgi:pyruvate kinase
MSTGYGPVMRQEGRPQTSSCRAAAKVRILATLGPASDTPAMIRRSPRRRRRLRINMSHGTHADHEKTAAIRGSSRA